MLRSSIVLVFELVVYAIKMHALMFVYTARLAVNPIWVLGSAFCGFKTGIIDGMRCMLILRDHGGESRKAEKSKQPKNAEDTFQGEFCYKKYASQSIHKKFLKGNLVIVITDITDSTNLWCCFPDAMYRTIEVYDEIARRLCKAHGGLEVRNEGDSFFLVFTDARNALDFSVEFYGEIKRISFGFGEAACSGEWENNKESRLIPLKVRIAVNEGPVVLRHDESLEVYGDVVTRAFRMLDHSNGKICAPQSCLSGYSSPKKGFPFCIHK
ncbi:similarity to the class 3 of adenyl cyclases Y891_MYCTU [Encephalitozoon cuniculi GB-M1]|uniref:Similarity to the class 3 of adenyl cyclases Y891_MYCTU n=1 Tax=Encephalitozoon cuniculi (strain GB-M1) TaxID=284813 RepID=Q8SVA4_ENCCU|nr:uncharacterized protein ECU06_0960 [Encephalitozoon cuniculi GB-M1]CAD25456.1 similarity to the class 3 of adenyl cyclases Y891_MYCTU [Encephalitozoon cuniculi GB-M1]